jgi:hypothetical protein
MTPNRTSPGRIQGNLQRSGGGIATEHLEEGSTDGLQLLRLPDQRICVSCTSASPGRLRGCPTRVLERLQFMAQQRKLHSYSLPPIT